MNRSLKHESLERAIKTSLRGQFAQANFQTNPEIFWDVKEYNFPAFTYRSNN